MQAILVADYSFTPLEYWRGVSRTAREFIKRCLTVDPAQRMTASEALAHAWIADTETSTEAEDLLPTVKKNFNARRTLHAAIDTIRAINQLRAGGGAAAMDGGLSRDPAKASETVRNAAPADEDVTMGEAGEMVVDSRGNARGQTDEMIREQERRIKETTQGLWAGR
jgi:calcium/calmodulin-dependent protein kinase I